MENLRYHMLNKRNSAVNLYGVFTLPINDRKILLFSRGNFNTFKLR